MAETSRVALVTGAGSGIGRAVALKLQAGGYDVTVLGRRSGELEKTAGDAKSGGGNFLVAPADVTDEVAVKAAFAKTRDRFGRLDLLFNNAGTFSQAAPLDELALAEWQRVVDVNLTGAFLTSRAIVPHMIARGYGRIVNVASIAGKEGNPTAAHYSASKAGLIGFTKSLAKELAPRNVVVNCITPAAARTEIFSQMKQEHVDYMLARIPMGRFLELDEVAALICWLASEDCSFSTGAVFDISGGRATY